MVSGSAVGNEPRKKLTDISNLPQHNQAAKPQPVSVNTEEYMKKLHRENMALVKHIADRNKIIELSARELERLRVNYQKLQQQNLQLAQTNSQMLAEINASKDKLRALQHELGCKNGLLLVRKLEPEAETKHCGDDGKFSQTEREKKPCNAKRKQSSKIQGTQETTVNPAPAKDVDKKRIQSRRQSANFKSGEQELNEDLSEIVDSKCTSIEHDTTLVKPVEAHAKTDKRRQSARFKSGEQEPIKDLSKIDNAVGFSTLKPVPDEGNVDNKRLCSRRRSTRLQSLEAQESTEPLSQSDDAKVSVSFPHDDLVHDTCLTSPVTSIKNETKSENSAPIFEAQELRRSSIRPMRQAAGKVQSYKEIPINVKMRRTS